MESDLETTPKLGTAASKSVPYRTMNFNLAYINSLLFLNLDKLFSLASTLLDTKG
ncbi:MAG: hypothetical protein GW823_03035 [Bacteroidetes bacterium]|nr:hypothetical protein [Bacteroidota bacterium]